MSSQVSESTPGSETPNQRLATVLLGKNVRDFIAERRAEGRSWRLIARDLHSATDGQVDVTSETLRTWAGEAVA